MHPPVLRLILKPLAILLFDFPVIALATTTFFKHLCLEIIVFRLFSGARPSLENLDCFSKTPLFSHCRLCAC
jgi:hypothetical protein